MEKGKEDRERRRGDLICSRRYHNSALFPVEYNLREFFCFQLSHSVQRNVSARGVMHETPLKQFPSIFAAWHGEAIHTIDCTHSRFRVTASISEHVQ